LSLRSLGWTPTHAESFSAFDPAEAYPARVFRTAAGALFVEGELGSVEVSPAGGLSEPPVVGDWVVVARDRPVAVAVLPRRGAFARKAAGRRAEAQIVAANVDVAFVLMGPGRDFSPRRLERYLLLARAAGVAPVVLLTKAALEPRDADVRAAEEVAGVDPVHAIDVLADIEGDAPRRYLAEGVTAVLVGSSGAGKSTLRNHLVGDAGAATSAVRASDGRGMHTTTHRELALVPGGGLVLDTPGMRELGLWASEDAALGAFPDVGALAAACRFRDCRHGREPGCAVRAAVEAGTLPAARLASFANLRDELASGEQRRTEQARRAEGKRGSKLVREALRRKGR
jgi:ribosome biogenesis GTPase